MRLGLVIHAIHCPKEAERIVRSFDALGPITKHVKLCLITEADYPDADLVHFNVSRARNIGLRRLLPECDGVVCIDADYILPPGLFELLMEPTIQRFHVWVRRRDCSEQEAQRRAWGEWLRLPILFPDCRGSCNYMSRENWLKMGGWDERLYGWGADDDVLHLRTAQFCIERRPINGIPLMHIEHPPRPWITQGENCTNNARWANEDQPSFLIETAT